VAAERVLRAMARVRTPSGLQTQASVGIAACPAHAETFDGLVERAGSALRSARRAVRREQPSAGTVTVSMAVWDDSSADELRSRGWRRGSPPVGGPPPRKLGRRAQSDALQAAV